MRSTWVLAFAVISVACGDDDGGEWHLRVCNRPLSTLCATAGTCPSYETAISKFRDGPECPSGTVGRRHVRTSQCGTLRTIEYAGFAGAAEYYAGGDALTGVYVWNDVTFPDGCDAYVYGTKPSCTAAEEVEVFCFADMGGGALCRAPCMP